MTIAVQEKPTDLDRQQKEIRRWIQEPVYWAKKFGGADFDPWSGQEQLWIQYGKVLNAKLKRHQGGVLTEEETGYANKMGISVMAGHGLGKERSIALIGLHYLFVLKRYKPKGVCTAPAGPTLHSTLWPEFGKVINGSEALQTIYAKQADRIYLQEDVRRGEFMRLEPRTIQQNSSPEEQGVVLAGIHATGVIYLVTEASGVQDHVFKPLEGGLTDPLSLIILIFNPTRRDGFAADSHGKNRRDWVCLQWSGRTLAAEKAANPGRFSWYNANVIEVLDRKFGRDSDFVRVRVDGLPPQKSSDSLIHYDAVMAAEEREVEILEHDPLSIGVDVGGDGEGGDPSVIAVMRGPKLVSLELHRVKTSVLADFVADLVSRERANMPDEAQIVVCIDYGGIGRAVYNDLADRHLMRGLYAVDVAEVPLGRAEEFHRLRDQIWWELREAFMESRDIAICHNEELIGQLTSIKWGNVALQGKTKIKVQGKGTSSGIPGVKPLLQSPNEADAVGLARFGYKHYCSRLSMASRRRVVHSYRRPVSWKVV